MHAIENVSHLDKTICTRPFGCTNVSHQLFFFHLLPNSRIRAHRIRYVVDGVKLTSSIKVEWLPKSSIEDPKWLILLTGSGTGSRILRKRTQVTHGKVLIWGSHQKCWKKVRVDETIEHVFALILAYITYYESSLKRESRKNMKKKKLWTIKRWWQNCIVNAPRSSENC